MAFRKYIIHTFLFFSLFIFFGTDFVAAHPFPYKAIETDLTIQNYTISFKTHITHVFEFEETEENERLSALTDYFGVAFTIWYENVPCEAKVTRLDENRETGESTFFGIYECLADITSHENLDIKSLLFDETFEKYDHYLTITLGDDTREIVFSDNRKNQTVPESDEERDPPSSIERFFFLGTEHILFGWDHILFLILVIALATSTKQTLVLVTTFTVAHSVTFLSAASGTIFVPANIVEPVIALSIVYVAARNIFILKYGKEKYFLQDRAIVVFVFGLIHGLGFASALGEAVSEKGSHLIALLSFNIGIEAGQLFVVLLTVPLLKIVERKLTIYRKAILLFVSGLIGIISFWWFLERLNLF